MCRRIFGKLSGFCWGHVNSLASLARAPGDASSTCDHNCRFDGGMPSWHWSSIGGSPLSVCCRNIFGAFSARGRRVVGYKFTNVQTHKRALRITCQHGVGAVSACCQGAVGPSPECRQRVVGYKFTNVRIHKCALAFCLPVCCRPLVGVLA